MQKVIAITIVLAASYSNAALAQMSTDPSCHPAKGEGAAWLERCEAAAETGDGQAAYIAASIYWNGDGVRKDNDAAETWFKKADLLGQSQAAFRIADAEYVKLTKATSPESVDRTTLQEAMDWYQRAALADPIPDERDTAKQRLVELAHFEALIQAKH